jgi:hypothetical protein
MNYMMKEGDSTRENVLPTSFAMTQFHICFLYQTNMTVVSMIS